MIDTKIFIAAARMVIAFDKYKSIVSEAQENPGSDLGGHVFDAWDTLEENAGKLREAIHHATPTEPTERTPNERHS